jgi:hypothetical protein
MPVLIYESERIAEYLHFIRRYRKKLVFAGRLEILAILRIGLTGYLYVSGTRYHSFVVDGLSKILDSARLDETLYQIEDWYQEKGQLLVFVTREFGR